MSDESTTGMQEVKPLREPQRDPEHCGRRMRKLMNPLPTGGLSVIWTCDACGAQVRETKR